MVQLLQLLAPGGEGLLYCTVLGNAVVEFADGLVPVVADTGKTCCCRWVKFGVRGARFRGGMSGGLYSSGLTAGGQDDRDVHADSASAKASKMGVVGCIGFFLVIGELVFQGGDAVAQAGFGLSAFAAQPGGGAGVAALQVLQFDRGGTGHAAALKQHAGVEGRQQHGAEQDGNSQAVGRGAQHHSTPVHAAWRASWRVHTPMQRLLPGVLQSYPAANL